VAVAVIPESLLPAIVSSADDAIFAQALDGTIVIWNPGAERIFGYTAEEILGRPSSLLLPPSRRHELDELSQAVRAGVHIRQRETVRLHKDGRALRVSLTVSPVRSSDGALVAASVVAREVTELVTTDSLREMGQQLQSIVEQMPVVLWTTDRDLRVTANWGTGGAASWRSGAAVGQAIQEYFESRGSLSTPIAQHQAALQGLSSRFEYEHHGRIYDLSLGPLRGTGGKVIGCIGVGLDITERKRTEDHMRHLATHDPLTGLANYRYFFESLESEIHRSARSERPFSLLLLDLDGLKAINDLHGHLVGDHALMRFAEVLRQHCRSTDHAARYGGDEFALLLIESDEAMARQVTARIEECLGRDSEQPALAVSAGYATYPADGLMPRVLISAADRRLYQCKSSRTARLGSSR
jgi:diguanylate cyclase (GGDEF)-like protein/PAS domain S-box-containing protein